MDEENRNQLRRNLFPILVVDHNAKYHPALGGRGKFRIPTSQERMLQSRLTLPDICRLARGPSRVKSFPYMRLMVLLR